MLREWIIHWIIHWNEVSELWEIEPEYAEIQIRYRWEGHLLHVWRVQGIDFEYEVLKTETEEDT